jgi:hypothetical protein
MFLIKSRVHQKGFGLPESRVSSNNPRSKSIQPDLLVHPNRSVERLLNVPSQSSLNRAEHNAKQARELKYFTSNKKIKHVIDFFQRKRSQQVLGVMSTERLKNSIEVTTRKGFNFNERTVEQVASVQGLFKLDRDQSSNSKYQVKQLDVNSVGTRNKSECLPTITRYKPPKTTHTSVQQSNELTKSNTI